MKPPSTVRWRARVAACLCAGLSAWLGPAAAASSGLPACPGVGAPKVLLDQQGALESIAFDRSGRLLFTQLFKGEVRRLDGPAASPVLLAKGVSQPGGLVVASERDLYVGTGNSLNGLLPSLGIAGVAHVDLATGDVTPMVKGLAMANGLARASDGTFYASDDLAKSLDRVLPDGTVQRGWLPLNSNGLALSRDEKTLYVNQMLPAKVLALDRASGAVRTVAAAPDSRTWTWLDGLGTDAHDRLYVVAYWAGEIWRVEPDTGVMCLLAQGLTMPSAVAVGVPGQGFAPDSVYVTTHSGRIHEVPHAVPASP